MEYGLRGESEPRSGEAQCVLILVLMEYGLRVLAVLAYKDLSLPVLILVLMEYGLRVLSPIGSNKEGCAVLILVLMEYGLRGVGSKPTSQFLP